MENISRSLGTDVAELEDVLKSTAPEKEAENKSSQIGKQYHPSLVPFIDDDYTYQSRQLDLELMENMLVEKLANVRSKLARIREIARTRQYPNIAFQEESRG